MRPAKVKQRDITDCGAACLASVAAYYKLKIPIARIRQLASTDKKGTNVKGLLEAAAKLSFDAKGVRGTMESLLKIPKPAIAHVIVNETLHHYVVIYKTTPSFITVMDPADGTLHNYNAEQFKKLWTGVLIILLPNQFFKQDNTKASVMSRFLMLMAPHKFIMTQALIGAFVYTLIGLTTSIYIQKIVDHVLIDGNSNLLNLMSTCMIVLLLIQIFIGTMKSIFTLQTGQVIDARQILGYYQHLLKLPQTFFDNMRVGEVTSRMNDAVKIRAFVNDVTINSAVNIFVVILSLGLMFTYYSKLALIILLVIPLYAIIYWITDRLNRKSERKLMENAADLETQVIESLTSIKTIKSFGLEQFMNQRTENRFASLLASVYVSGKNSILSGNVVELVSRTFTIVLLWTGSYYVLEQQITSGELLSFYALINYFTSPISSLIGMNKTIQNAMIAADRLFEIMDLQQEEDTDKIVFEPDMMGDISFRNVKFRYGSRADVFENMNLDIGCRTVTAIVGESGSGKSTLMALLQKLYPLQEGHIRIGEYDLKYIENESLRNMISVVPQHIDLFAGNVIDNIAVGIYRPDVKKIVDICSRLGIMDFIEGLPENFYTYLGENGVMLSGGQKQRIAIARALYRDPQILILDEATSSLDSVSEEYVLRTIHLLREQNRTVIIIAHRLSTVLNADKIIVLEKGKVLEQGTHALLIAKQGHYFSLWKKQFPL